MSIPSFGVGTFRLTGQAQQLRLDEADMASIAVLERNGREVSPSGVAPIWD